MTEVDINIIAWFSPEFVDKKEKGTWIREARCRACGKTVSSIVVPETLTDEVRATARADAELFLAHLQTAHADYWGSPGSEAT